jgi:hypothetical protein
MHDQPNMLFFKTQCLLQMLHTTMSVNNCKSNFTFLFVQLKKTTNWRDYVWDCRGNSTITHFEGNSNNQKQKNCSHNLLSVRPSSTSWIAVISCHDCQLTSSAPTSDCRIHIWKSRRGIEWEFGAFQFSVVMDLNGILVNTCHRDILKEKKTPFVEVNIYD